MLFLEDIFKIALESSINEDPRGKKQVKELLEDVKEDYKNLSEKEKKFFDKEKLVNPYTDSRILFNSDKKTKIKRILAGIDIGTEELLLAKELTKSGNKIDAVVAHHPLGVARAQGLGEMMRIQEEIAIKWGVPINVVEKLMEPRIQEVVRALAPGNNERCVDAAKLLNIPLMCLHTVADNHVHSYIEKFLQKKKVRKLGDILDSLLEIEEYKIAASLGMGPDIYSGGKNSRVGKIAVTGMTGGTEGSEDIYERYAHAGVGTVIEMHISDSRKEKAKKFHLNVIMAGHMARDSLGLNLMFDKIAKKGVEIVPCSGFIRVGR